MSTLSVVISKELYSLQSTRVPTGSSQMERVRAFIIYTSSLIQDHLPSPRTLKVSHNVSLQDE